MNLHEYYRNHKDAINASIMDIACDLAVGRLLNAHGAPFETFVEADDPDDPDGGTHYKEEYQKEYDTYYDKEYARVAKLMKFDYCQEDGVAASPEDTNTKTLYLCSIFLYPSAFRPRGAINPVSTPVMNVASNRRTTT